MAVNTETRNRRIAFTKPLAPGEMATLQAALLQLEGTTRVEVGETKMTVEYEFPTSSFDDLWQVIGQQVRPDCLTLPARLRHCLAAFAEQNEKDHLLYPRHWHTYTQDIYVQYFDNGQSGKSETREQLWRRYRKKP